MLFCIDDEDAFALIGKILRQLSLLPHQQNFLNHQFAENPLLKVVAHEHNDADHGVAPKLICQVGAAAVLYVRLEAQGVDAAGIIVAGGRHEEVGYLQEYGVAERIDLNRRDYEKVEQQCVVIHSFLSFA